ISRPPRRHRILRKKDVHRGNGRRARLKSNRIPIPAPNLIPCGERLTVDDRHDGSGERRLLACCIRPLRRLLVLSPSDFGIEISCDKLPRTAGWQPALPRTRLIPVAAPCANYDGCGLFFNNATADTNTSKPPNVQTIAAPD